MRDFETINENLRHALAAFSYVRRSGQVARAQGISLSYAGVAFSLFNTALLTEPLPGEAGAIEDVLSRAEDFFQLRSAPWSIWFCEDYLTTDERRRSRIVLASRGMRLMMDAPGMISTRLADCDRTLPQLVFRLVGDERTRADFSLVMSHAFQVPEHMSRSVYSSETLWLGPMRGWIAYLDGMPISTAATIAGGDCIGLYAVATMPSQQRKGCGEAVMRHALEQARMETGIERSILQSSSAGYPLYVRMGYRNVTRFCVYVKA